MANGKRLLGVSGAIAISVAAVGAGVSAQSPSAPTGDKIKLGMVTHVVGKDQKLFFYYEVYDPGQTGGAPPQLRTSLAFYRGKIKVFETPVVERVPCLQGLDRVVGSDFIREIPEDHRVAHLDPPLIGATPPAPRRWSPRFTAYACSASTVTVFSQATLAARQKCPTVGRYHAATRRG